MFVEIMCWASIGLIVYSYLVYPIILALLAKLSPQKSPRKIEEIPVDQWPMVSLVIAAYREESVIVERLNNALQIDYPGDNIEIIIGVDGNEDATGELINTFQDTRIRLMQFPERRGKASVLNDCIAVARGEIILFSDANTFWDADAAKLLVRHFEDKQVGGVCGRLLLTDGSTGENVDGIYWRYENRLKEWEGKLGALLGANGAIYAIRKEIYQPIPSQTIVDDFVIGMRIHQSGYQLLYEKEAIAREETAPTISDELQRRTRIGAGAFQSLTWLWRLLLPRYPLVSWAFWSHKVFRWFCPAFMVIALVSNFLLAQTPLYQTLLALQGIFYTTAVLGNFSLLPGKLGKFAQAVWMFVNMNIALALGFNRWLFNTQKGTWKRTERSETES